MPKKPPSPLALIQAATADAAHAVGQSFGMDFNSLNPLASIAAQQQSTKLVREVTQATRQGLAAAVTRGLEEGLPPRVLARTIKPMIGLTSKQTQAVFNARASWAAGGLSGTLLEKRTARYAEKLLKARAMNIARTETIFSLNAGQTAAWEHAANQGRLQPERTQKKWVARSGGERTCPICGRMNGQIVGFRDLFVTPLGRRLSHPPAHPQCRCTVVLISNKKTQQVSLPKRMKVAAERDTGVRPIPQNRWEDDPARNNVLTRSVQTLDEIDTAKAAGKKVTSLEIMGDLTPPTPARIAFLEKQGMELVDDVVDELRQYEGLRDYSIKRLTLVDAEHVLSTHGTSNGWCNARTRQIMLSFGDEFRVVKPLTPDNIGFQRWNLSNRSSRATLIHEIGHDIHMTGMLDVADYDEWYDLWVRNQPNTGKMLSKYSATNQHEFFAEAFSSYIHGEDILHRMEGVEDFFKRVLGPKVNSKKSATFVARNQADEIVQVARTVVPVAPTPATTYLTDAQIEAARRKARSEASMRSRAKKKALLAAGNPPPTAASPTTVYTPPTPSPAPVRPVATPVVAPTNQSAVIYITPKPPISDPAAIEAARRKARSEASMRSRAKKKARLAGLTASEAMDMTGLTVRYAKPLKGEKAFRFKVLEDRGDRLLLQVIGWHNPILVPTEVVARSAVTIVR